MFEKNENNETKILIDLSNAADEDLMSILLRVPAKDLVKICTKVSKQWNRILAQNFFWRDKMEQDGYRLEWRQLAGLSTESFKTIALRRAFGRNFLKDSWDLSFRDERCLKLDPRWHADPIVGPNDNSVGAWARIEIPPVFLDGQPDMPAELGEPIEACLATGYFPFRKRILIELADEGLTDEIMDNIRPTIVVSEMVANRGDCASEYEMICSLKMNADNEDDLGLSDANGNIRQFDSDDDSDVEDEDEDDGNHEQMNNEGQSVDVTYKHNLDFAQGQAEGWNKVEHVFKEYPAGMRYLVIQCSGSDSQLWAGGHYGVKLANCSVKALCEKNATE